MEIQALTVPDTTGGFLCYGWGTPESRVALFYGRSTGLRAPGTGSCLEKGRSQPLWASVHLPVP